MEPLAFVAAILGAGGLGVILRIVLSSSGRQQQGFNDALQQQRAAYQAFLENQRDEFESFLGEHMRANREAMENLVTASERLGDRLTAEHRDTREFLRDQAQIVRDGHRRLASQLAATRGTARVGRELDEVMREIERREGER